MPRLSASTIDTTQEIPPVVDRHAGRVDGRGEIDEAREAAIVFAVRLPGSIGTGLFRDHRPT